MPTMTPTQQDTFLTEPRSAILSVTRGPDTPPLQVPLWYLYDAEHRTVEVVIPRHSLKARHLQAHRRCSLMVEEYGPRVRYVCVSGPVTAIRPAPAGKVRQIAARYLPAEAVDGYVDMAVAEHGEHIAVTVEIGEVFSSDLGEW